ncbi:MAG TPA: AI-2E family transporter [Dyella sp.]|uniref:AI-2E family transporter n=1 Tax=Dyella sp. TaxID=1869338 RepID=UPI002F93519B
MSASSTDLPPPGSTSEPIVAMPVVAVPKIERKLSQRLHAAHAVRRHLRAIRIILNIFLALALLYTITLIKALLIPLVLAGFIGLALNPLVHTAARKRIPRWLSASVLVICLIAGIGAGVSVLAPAALHWFHDVPSVIRNVVPKLRSVVAPIEAANRATQSLVGTPVRAQPPRPAALAFNVWDVASTTPKVVAAILTVILLVFFFLIYGDLILRRLVEASPTFSYKRHAVSIVRGIQSEVSRYLLTTIVINGCLGAVTAGMLWLYGIPDPLLWGAVAMLANFIPYVGAITTTSVLALVGLMNIDNPGQALLPALTFAAITAVEGNLITPLIQGRRMRLSPIAILLWLLLWGWLWGIPGALLAVPMLTSAKLIAERVRGWGWFAQMVQR